MFRVYVQPSTGSPATRVVDGSLQTVYVCVRIRVYVLVFITTVRLGNFYQLSRLTLGPRVTVNSWNALQTVKYLCAGYCNTEFKQLWNYVEAGALSLTLNVTEECGIHSATMSLTVAI